MEKWPYINLSELEIKKYQKLIDKLKKWIEKKVFDANAKGIVLGISGGIDSATLAMICKDIFQKNANFYYLKTKKDLENEKDIKKLNAVLDNSIKTINLKKQFNSLSKKFSLKNNWIKANTKSRFFMNVLYTKAQQNDCLVLGTDNYNEYFLGYFTKWGDGGCDLLPFANLLKSDIYKIAAILKVPNSIIKKRPSANLLNNQYDEEELGFSYEEFEKYIKNPLDSNPFTAKKIKALHKKTAHKRNPIPKGPKL